MELTFAYVKILYFAKVQSKMNDDKNELQQIEMKVNSQNFKRNIYRPTRGAVALSAAYRLSTLRVRVLDVPEIKMNVGNVKNA